jgi:hypothetical protein
MRTLNQLNSRERDKFIATFNTAQFVFKREVPKNGIYWYEDYLHGLFLMPRYVLRWPLEHLQHFADANCRDLVQRNAIELHQVPVFTPHSEYNLTLVGNMAYVFLNYTDIAIAQKAILWLESLEKHFTVSK